MNLLLQSTDMYCGECTAAKERHSLGGTCVELFPLRISKGQQMYEQILF